MGQRVVQIAIVIPCYNVQKHILGVLSKIDSVYDLIVVVDDCCPQNTGQYVESNSTDDRITVVYHEKNMGVGAAVKTGYQKAAELGASVMVKIDGDGQMDPDLIPLFVNPILKGRADYTKGNRFYSIYNVRSMPRTRLYGNMALSFLTKLSSGYWSIFDPTNGYTAIHANTLKQLELKNIGDRYFFESDMLINLGNIRAVVEDIPMEAVYGDEESNLNIRNIFKSFLFSNIKSFIKRVLYNYYFRDFNIASLSFVFGILMISSGSIFGLLKWYESISQNIPATAGTVMIPALFIIIGTQAIFSFLNYDIMNEPTRPLLRTAMERRRLITPSDTNEDD